MSTETDAHHGPKCFIRTPAESVKTTQHFTMLRKTHKIKLSIKLRCNLDNLQCTGLCALAQTSFQGELPLSFCWGSIIDRRAETRHQCAPRREIVLRIHFCIDVSLQVVNHSPFCSSGDSGWRGQRDVPNNTDLLQNWFCAPLCKTFRPSLTPEHRTSKLHYIISLNAQALQVGRCSLTAAPFLLNRLKTARTAMTCCRDCVVYIVIYVVKKAVLSS